LGSELQSFILVDGNEQSEELPVAYVLSSTCPAELQRIMIMDLYIETHITAHANNLEKVFKLYIAGALRYDLGMTWYDGPFAQKLIFRAIHQMQNECRIETCDIYGPIIGPHD
jgi:hypothetical protein